MPRSIIKPWFDNEYARVFILFTKFASLIIGQFVWGESPTDADIEYMIKEADTDGDGFLHYSDFIRKIKSIH